MTAWRKEENAMSKYEPIVNNFKMDADGRATINGGKFGRIESFNISADAAKPYASVTITFDVDGDLIIDLPAYKGDANDAK